MIEALYNKISITYQLLSNTSTNSFGLSEYRFHKKFETNSFSPEQLNLLIQLSQYCLEDFFKEEHLTNSYYSEEFLRQKIVIFDSENIYISLETPQILFGYLLYYFKDSIMNLVNVLRSNRFKENFKYDVDINDSSVKFTYYLRNKIIQYLENNVENVDYIFHLMRNAPNTSYIFNTHSNIFVETENISEVLEYNIEVYDFSKIVIT